MFDGIAVNSEDIQRVAAAMYASAETIAEQGTKVGGCDCGPDHLGRDYRGAGTGFVDGHALMARVVAMWTASAESLASDVLLSVSGYAGDDAVAADALDRTWR